LLSGSEKEKNETKAWEEQEKNKVEMKRSIFGIPYP
jgi:hypothetical protein